MIKFLTIMILLFSGFSALMAQAAPDSLSAAEREQLARDLAKLKQQPMHGFAEISFLNSVPQDEFMDNLQRSGPGFMINGGWSADPLPISLGLESGCLFYGGDERRFTYSRSGGWEPFEDTVSYNNLMVPITAFVRIQSNFVNILYPYIELFSGVNILIATSHLSPAFGLDDSKSETTSSFNYGVGAGTMIKIADFVKLPDTRTQILFDIKFRYMFGSNTNYYKVMQINNDSSPEFAKYKSKTDIVTFSAGFTFRF